MDSNIMSSYYFHKKNIFQFQNKKGIEKTYFIKICDAIPKPKCIITKFGIYHTLSWVKFPNDIYV
jgi:hypothetical protein